MALRQTYIKMQTADSKFVNRFAYIQLVVTSHNNKMLSRNIDFDNFVVQYVLIFCCWWHVCVFVLSWYRVHLNCICWQILHVIWASSVTFTHISVSYNCTTRLLWNSCNYLQITVLCPGIRELERQWFCYACSKLCAEKRLTLLCAINLVSLKEIAQFLWQNSFLLFSKRINLKIKFL